MLNIFKNLYINFPLPNRFVRCHKIFLDHSKSLYIGYCEFDTEFFSFNVQKELSINIPDALSLSSVKRKSEFIAGRYATKIALQASQKENINKEVKIGKYKQPVFPEGYLGTITHSGSIALCLLTQNKEVKFLGVDIEPIINKDDLLALEYRIYSKNEMQHFLNIGIDPYKAATCIFSAKESIFKAYFNELHNNINFQKFKLTNVVNNRNSIEMIFKLYGEYQKFFTITSVTAIVHKKHILTFMVG